MNPQTLSLGAYQASFVRELRLWREENRVRRLWEKDASLWTGKGEARWLGWLDSGRGAGVRFTSTSERTFPRASELSAYSLRSSSGPTGLPGTVTAA